MMPNEVKELLRDRAEHVHLHGDFAPAAIRGARRVRTRRAVTAAMAGVLAVAIPLGLTSRDVGPDRGAPATSPPAGTQLPESQAVNATARSGAPMAQMPVPYVQGGLLHLRGRTTRVADPGRALILLANLSNGGVVYQAAGPNPDTPSIDAGPLTFLDASGRQIRALEVLDSDVDGGGDIVTGVDASGAHVALDTNGELLRQFVSPDLVSPFPTGLDELIGNRPAVNLVGGEPYLWLGNVATGRSFTLREQSRGSLYKGLAVHEGRSLVIQAQWGYAGVQCKVLVDFRTGERLRDWCDRERIPTGFSPSGDWMYGGYENAPGAWVERTDDGVRLLEVRADSAAGDQLAGQRAPSPDGSALLLTLTARDGTTVTASCAIRSGACTVLGDGEPARDEITLPMNWGR